MFGGGEKKETLRSIVSFEALEIAGYKHSVQNPSKKQWVTMVAKRGKQQRFETINDKLCYVPLDAGDDKDLDSNT